MLTNLSMVGWLSRCVLFEQFQGGVVQGGRTSVSTACPAIHDVFMLARCLGGIFRRPTCPRQTGLSVDEHIEALKIALDYTCLNRAFQEAVKSLQDRHLGKVHRRAQRHAEPSENQHCVAEQLQRKRVEHHPVFSVAVALFFVAKDWEKLNSILTYRITIEDVCNYLVFQGAPSHKLTSSGRRKVFEYLSKRPGIIKNWHGITKLLDESKPGIYSKEIPLKIGLTLHIEILLHNPDKVNDDHRQSPVSPDKCTQTAATQDVTEDAEPDSTRKSLTPANGSPELDTGLEPHTVTLATLPHARRTSKPPTGPTIDTTSRGQNRTRCDDIVRDGAQENKSQKTTGTEVTVWFRRSCIRDILRVSAESLPVLTQAFLRDFDDTTIIYPTDIILNPIVLAKNKDDDDYTHVGVMMWRKGIQVLKAIKV